MAGASAPLLYEVAARHWLARLSARHGPSRSVTTAAASGPSASADSPAPGQIPNAKPPPGPEARGHQREGGR